MKLSHSLKHVLILVLIPFGFTACTGLTVTPPSPDYIAGKKYSNNVAKQDAMNDHCFHYYPRNHFNLYRNLNQHRQKLAAKGHTQEFINGFSYGYKSNYVLYEDLYCGF